MTADLKDILFIDIETVRVVENHDALNERFKAQWARKASFFKREDGITDADLFHDRAGIYAEFGKIIVIAIGKYFDTEDNKIGLKTKYFSGSEEKGVLEDFKITLEKTDPTKTKLCAHNGKEFDFPYLCRRMLVNSIQLPSLLNISGRKSWEVPHLDTMEMWKFGDYKHYTSLDLLAALFEIPTSKEQMDGSMVNEVYYKEKDLNKISEYCVRDVVAIAQLYLRMRGLPLIEDHNIIKT